MFKKVFFLQNKTCFFTNELGGFTYSFSIYLKLKNLFITHLNKIIISTCLLIVLTLAILYILLKNIIIVCSLVAIVVECCDNFICIQNREFINQNIINLVSLNFKYFALNIINDRCTAIWMNESKLTKITRFTKV